MFTAPKHPTKTLNFNTLPLHPLGFAAFPILALIASNLHEISLQSTVRSLVISVLSAISLFLACRLILRDRIRAGIITSLLLALFFSYGHIYSVLENVSLAGIQFGRHRYLVIIYAAILIVGLWLLLRKEANLAPANQVLNIVSLTLVVLPTLQIGWQLWHTSTQEKQTTALLASSNLTLPNHPDSLPDVYYIILDSYTRADALKADFNFDNSDFVNQLTQMGFTVAECSRSNYGFTQGSIAAALNYDYLPQLEQELSQNSPGENIWVLLKHSRVRSMLESIGYITVAFDTGYEWSRLTDADVYISLGSDSLAMQMINPFEAMLIRSTAGLILSDSRNQSIRAGFEDINFPHSFHVNNQRFILAQLPELAKNPKPKFVFVHLLVPHYPFVFDKNGGVNQDPGYYSGEKSGPVNEEYMINGYVGQVQFINKAIVDVLGKILEESQTQPIIIMNGDHGLKGDNRHQIFNAYYLPGDIQQNIYPAISPVNSFRLVFDTYYGTSLGFLEDISFNDEGNIVSETSPLCANR